MDSGDGVSRQNIQLAVRIEVCEGECPVLVDNHVLMSCSFTKQVLTQLDFEKRVCDIACFSVPLLCVVPLRHPCRTQHVRLLLCLLHRLFPRLFLRVCLF